MPANRTTANSTVNVMRQLETLLETTGLPFAIDSWVNEAPTEYGVINLEGQKSADWGDGKMLDAEYQARLRIYVNGQGDEWVQKIQTKLEAADVGYFAPVHEYMEDIRKTSWTWLITFFSPLQYETAGE